MKTFSIATGSYMLPDEAAMSAGAQSVVPAGGVAPDINTAEAQAARDHAELQKLAAAAGGAAAAEPAPEPAAEVHPLHIGAGDTVEFGVDPADYSVCVLTAHHPDGSSDWLRIRRNGCLIESGYTAAPEPAGAAEGESEGTPASMGAAAVTDNIDVEPEPVPEEEFSGSHSRSGRGRGHHR